MTSLTDPVTGFAADDVARAVGLSPVARVEALEREVARLNRILTTVLQTFRGFDVEGGKAFVTPEPGTGQIRIHSTDGTVIITDAPAGGAHSIDLSVPDVDTGGCTVAWGQINVQQGTNPVTADECGDIIEFSGRDTATYARVVTYGTDSGTGVGTLEKVQDLIVVSPVEGAVVGGLHNLKFRGDDGKDYTVTAKRGGASSTP